MNTQSTNPNALSDEMLNGANGGDRLLFNSSAPTEPAVLLSETSACLASAEASAACLADADFLTAVKPG